MCVLFVVIWMVAGALIQPANRVVGGPPADFPASSISIESQSGTSLKAWYRPVSKASATVILLHPLRGDRRDMLDRARLLHRRGYSTLLVDLQAHGESIGENITVGHREKFDVLASVEFVRDKSPDNKVAIIGWSLGGAAAVLASPEIDLLVLESVFPTLEEAVHNRVKMRLGPLHHVLAPLLLMQLRPRLGISSDQIRPIDHLAKMSCPVLVASGDQDVHTTLDETRRMFDKTNEPKKLVVFEGAKHEDLFQFDQAKYEQEILNFLDSVLTSD